jgi:hypothetical protein
MKKLLILPMLLSLAVLPSCIKDEIPVGLPDAGDVIQNEFEMGTDYRYNAYYDFETNTFVKEHLKTEWDLGFETGPNGWRVVLNSAKAMFAGQSPSDFQSTLDTVGVFWKFDASSWNLDSTAVGDWQSYGGAYVLDRGYSWDGTQLGFKKIEIQSVSETAYTVRFAELDGSNEMTVEIPKQNNYNFTFFSFDSNHIVSIEPPKYQWDLVFRQYLHKFEGHAPYLVTGVLSNTNGVEVAEMFDTDFSEITLEDVQTVNFNPAIDVIGYDWKTFNAGSYITHPEKVYIVKTTEGFFYKLRFTDFYSDLGDKGTPKFECQSL